MTKRISSIILVFTFLFGSIFMLNLNQKEVFANNSQGNSLYYFTDTLRPSLTNTYLTNFTNREVKYYDSQTWDAIFQDPTMDQLFSVNNTYTLIDQEGAVDDYTDVGGIVVIELRLTLADGNALNQLFANLQYNGHRVMFISEYDASDYNAISFIRTVDEFIVLGSNSIYSFVNEAFQHIVNNSNPINNIRILMAKEFFPNCNSYSVQNLYDNYTVFRLLVDKFIEFYDDEPEDIEYFLIDNGIDICIYNQYDEFYSVLEGWLVDITFDGINNPQYPCSYLALSVNYMCQGFYEYLYDYQDDTYIDLTNYKNFTINKLPIFVHGEMNYNPNGLLINGGTSGNPVNDPYLYDYYEADPNDITEAQIYTALAGLMV